MSTSEDLRTILPAAPADPPASIAPAPPMDEPADPPAPIAPAPPSVPVEDPAEPPGPIAPASPAAPIAEIPPAVQHRKSIQIYYV